MSGKIVSGTINVGQKARLQEIWVFSDVGLSPFSTSNDDLDQHADDDDHAAADDDDDDDDDDIEEEEEDVDDGYDGGFL